MTLKEIAEALRKAERMGNDRDVPEGARYIQISDTLANTICLFLTQLHDNQVMGKKRDL